MLLEALATSAVSGPLLPSTKHEAGYWEYDWSPLVPMLLDDSISIGERAAKFHLALENVICDLALRAKEELGIQQVGLTGGVFQNKRLFEEAADKLTKLGLECITEPRLPVSDGGLCVGQVREYAATLLRV